MTPAHIGYLLHPCPLGEVLIVTTGEGVVTLHPLRGRLDDELERLAHRLGGIPERTDDDPVAAAAGRQLDEYFAGDRQDFDVDLDWRLVRGFTRAALEAVRKIPYGETAGYGEVAAHAGSPRASRAVGTAMATNPIPIVVPCHRVLRTGGNLGGYGGGLETKVKLLALESGEAQLF